MTEAKLALILEATVGDLYAGDVAELVDEVRRLRAIISNSADYTVGSDAWCHGCRRTLITRSHERGCPIGALQAEGEAIRGDLAQGKVAKL